MKALVLDAGALIALDRGHRDTWALVRAISDDRGLLIAPAGAIAQTWRDGRRQVRLARALRQCDEAALDPTTARAAGALCGTAGTSDIVDASVAIAAARVAPNVPTTLLTSDPDDLRRLVSALDAAVLVEAV
jgi:hypothetical protein